MPLWLYSSDRLYQRSLIMTHRDGFPGLSARSAWRGDAGHRTPCAPSESHGQPESLGKPPFRSDGRTGSGRFGGGRRKALTMSRRTRGFPPTRPLARRIACTISMGHYQRSLVSGPAGPGCHAFGSGRPGRARQGRCRKSEERRRLTVPTGSETIALFRGTFKESIERCRSPSAG